MRVVPGMLLCALFGCDDPSLGTQRASLEGLGVLYRVDSPRVDADLARARAATFGITAAVVEHDQGFSATGDGKALFVDRETGGLRFSDLAKLDAAGYVTTIGSQEAIDFAIQWLAERGLLPAHYTIEPAAAMSVGAEPITLEEDEAGNAITIPGSTETNHFVVRIHPYLLVTERSGAEVRRRLDGGVITVEVGNHEVIGLDWDVPTLTEGGAVPLYSFEEAIANLPEAVPRDQIADPELVYRWEPYSDRPPALLSPTYVFPAGEGVAFTEASAHVPRTTLHAPATPPRAGDRVDAEVEVEAGTPPYTITWRAWRGAHDESPILGEGLRLAGAIVPEGTRWIDVSVIDANGVAAAIANFPVMYTMQATGPGQNVHASAPAYSPQYNTWKIMGGGAPWQASFYHTSREALSLRNVRIFGQRVLEVMSMPFYQYTSAASGPRSCYLGTQGPGQPTCRAKRIETQCWNGVATNGITTIPCNDPAVVPLPWYSVADGWIPTTAYHNKPFDDNSLVIQSFYEVTGLKDPAQQTPDDCKLLFQITYVMAPTVADWAACGSFDGNPCWRWYPVVQYWYANAAGDDWCADDGLTDVVIGQRYVPYLDNLDFEEMAGFVNDDDVGPFEVGTYTTFTSHEIAKTMVDYGAPGDQFASIATPWPDRADNLHVRDAEHFIYVPGCYGWVPALTPSETPDRRCMHAHWAWTGLNWLLDVIPGNNAGEFTGASPGSGFTTYAKVPGSQFVETLILKHNSAEVPNLPALVPQGSAVASANAVVHSWNNGQNLNWTMPGDPGTDLQIFVISAASASAGLNGLNDANWVTAEHYDQFNLSDYFFE